MNDLLGDRPVLPLCSSPKFLVQRVLVNATIIKLSEALAFDLRSATASQSDSVRHCSGAVMLEWSDLRTMKALLLSQYRRLELTDMPDPAPGAGEVLVRVAACGICGSDVHGYDGSSGRRIPPIVMGHEAAGTVAAVGSGVNGLHQGD